VWFNSMRREEPYLGLTCDCTRGNALSSQEAVTQVLHGCRQLVP
jgi:hypothetical protein